ncbi:uncharacterized protein L201_003431 [Kwoniella dendrophila CBS 6074]|uniref:Inositol-pentakisphosphate 2-kinase n=1 Tax=Kwoniella dendrophila CBS 6074 TaxID=1295534 RepID=A0AAX4JVC3_9TREE
MVSILSFFNKKKGKKVRSRSPSPTSSPIQASAIPRPASSAGFNNGNKPNRFLSMRQKSSSSSTNQNDHIGRRGSGSELTRKRSKVRSPTSSKTNLTEAFLPKLELGFDIPQTGDSIQGGDQLDIHGVGEKVELKGEEKGVIDSLRLSTGEVKLAWEVIGKALRESDLDTHGLMLPLRPNTSITTQLYLLALYTLAIRPDLLSQFPTIAAQFAQPTSNPSEIWRERLTSILKDTESTSDIAETLKYTLRRLYPSPLEPLIDVGLYTKFVKAEQAASYPLDAYETLFSPRLKAGISNYLNEIFEVWSAIIIHAEQNTMTPGRIAHLLGWWTWGLGGDKIDNWKHLYHEWKNAGQSMEHLLYVWIRHQSTKSQLPTRLLELVESYPFSTSVSSETLPLPPSSFARQTLHVTLTSSVPVKEIACDPNVLLNAARSAQSDENTDTPLWLALTGETEGKGDHSTLLAEDSLKFLNQIGGNDDTTSITTPALIDTPQSVPLNDTPLYQPFSSTANGSNFRGRYHSHSGDLSSPSNGMTTSTTSPNLSSLGSPNEEDTPKSLKKQASLGILPKFENSAWDDFQKSGFGDSPKTVDQLGLTFSPKSTNTPSLSPVASLSTSDCNVQRSKAKKKATFDDPKHTKVDYGIEHEEVIEIDDAFMAFVEDAQLDTTITRSWPPFSLLRLASPIPSTKSKDPIEWLLVTVTYRPPPLPPPPPAEPISETSPERSFNRATSPSSSSRGNTPRGFKGITESFKRSSSFQSGMNLRKSFFGTSAFSLSKHASDELATLTEDDISGPRELRAPLSAQSLTPTEYTITEMGEMVKIPSPKEKSQSESTATPAMPALVKSTLNVEKDTDAITIKGSDVHGSISSGPSVDTLATEWQYVGEGAEHIVFSYIGSSSKEYNGKVIRLRKSQFIGNSPTDPEYRETQNQWISNLLPKLVPLELVIETREIILSENWTKELFTNADSVRPEERKLLGDLKSLVVGESKGMIMEDTTMNQKQDGRVNLAFEIKPKWGFLPDPSTITPPEAARIKSQVNRFIMHRHYKEHDVSADVQFDPLDLYSGDETKMGNAIKGLWSNWRQSEGKENNWRVFVDGQRVIPGKVETLARYFDGQDFEDQIATAIIPILETSTVFQTLKNLQSTLDPTDISDLASRFSSAYPQTEVFDTVYISNPTTEELKDFIEIYLRSPSAGKSDDSWSLRQRMIAFALSAIFKDCSVFVKFTLTSTDHSNNGNGNGKWEVVENSGKVKMIDLDLKPIQNLKKWKDTDDKIWKYWLETHPSPASTNIIDIESKVDQKLGEEQEDESIIQENGKSSSSLLDIPIRHKAIPGLTFGGDSENGLDDASTKALFVHTPDITRENTPLPTQISFPGIEQSTEHKLNPPQAISSGQNDQAMMNDDVRLRNESLTEPQHVQDDNEIRRTKRSLAPSPSPPPPVPMVLPSEDDQTHTLVHSNPEELNTTGMLASPEHTSIPMQDPESRAPSDAIKDLADDRISKADSGTIVEAGIAGVNEIADLALEAVATIKEDLTELITGDDEKTEVQEEAITDEKPSPQFTQEQSDVADTTTLPERETIAPTAPDAPDPSDEVDGLMLPEVTQSQTSEIPDPAEETVEDINIPQAELDNFYTPTETPLIAQIPSFEQSFASLSDTTAQQETPASIPEESVVRINEEEGHDEGDPERVEEQDNVKLIEPIESFSSAVTPKFTNLTIEAISPETEDANGELLINDKLSATHDAQDVETTSIDDRPDHSHSNDLQKSPILDDQPSHTPPVVIGFKEPFISNQRDDQAGDRERRADGDFAAPDTQAEGIVNTAPVSFDQDTAPHPRSPLPETDNININYIGNQTPSAEIPETSHTSDDTALAASAIDELEASALPPVEATEISPRSENNSKEAEEQHDIETPKANEETDAVPSTISHPAQETIEKTQPSGPPVLGAPITTATGTPPRDKTDTPLDAHPVQTEKSEVPRADGNPVEPTEQREKLIDPNEEAEVPPQAHEDVVEQINTKSAASVSQGEHSPTAEAVSNPAETLEEEIAQQNDGNIVLHLPPGNPAEPSHVQKTNIEA